MKPLSDWVNPFKRHTFFRTLHFSCSTCCRHCRNQMAMALLLLLTAFLPLYAQPAIQWDKTIGGNGGDYLRSLQQTPDGGYILGGSSDSGISGDKTEANRGNSAFTDYWVVKLDLAGNKQWDKTFGGTQIDILYSLQQTSDGGYVLGGYSGSSISGDITQGSRGSSDYWVVKLAPFPEARQLESFTLINAKTGQPIGPLQDGDTLRLAHLPTRRLNIRADTDPDTGAA